MDREFLQERIDKLKLLIEKYEDALDALSGGIESYTLDTGQSRQTVKRYDIDRLHAVVDGLYNRLCTLEARLNGATITARPSW
jgi:hypothetical protein